MAARKTKEQLKEYFKKGLENCFPMTPNEYKQGVIKAELYNKYVFGSISMEDLHELREYFGY